MEESTDENIDEAELLSISRAEAQRMVDNQIQTLSDIDQKAARILRINLVLLSILITGFSLASNQGASGDVPVHFSQLLNRYTLAGFVFLLLSTATAIVTYTASKLTVGLRGSDLQAILDNDYSPQRNLEGIIESYAEWIQENYKTNAKNAPLGTLTLLFLLYAMTAFALGLKKGLTGQVEPWMLAGILLGLCAVTHFTGFIGQINRYRDLRDG